MVEYRDNLLLRKKRLKQTITYSFRALLIIGVYFFLISAFLIIVGIVDDKEALREGIPCVIVSFGFLLIPFISYMRAYKMLILPLKHKPKEYYEIFTVEKTDEYYIFENKTLGDIQRISNRAIIKIVEYKDILIIYLTGNGLKSIPKSEEAEILFESYLIRRKNPKRLQK